MGSVVMEVVVGTSLGPRHPQLSRPRPLPSGPWSPQRGVGKALRAGPRSRGPELTAV